MIDTPVQQAEAEDYLRDDFVDDTAITAARHVNLLRAPEGSVFGDLYLYLQLSEAPQAVWQNLPFRLMSWAARLATLKNKEHPVLWFTNSEPFRFIYHTIDIAPSGYGKGLTDGAFREIVGPKRVHEFISGTLEGLRNRKGQWIPRERKFGPPLPGPLAKATNGWLSFPEAHALTSAATRDGHSVSMMIRFMEKGETSWDLNTESGSIRSNAALCFSIQPVLVPKLVGVIGQGLARRAMIETYPAPNPEETRRTAFNLSASPTSNLPLLNGLRANVESWEACFQPSSYDWSDVEFGSEHLTKAGLVRTLNDHQLIQTVAVAQTILNEPNPKRWYKAPFKPTLDVKGWRYARSLIENRNTLSENAAKFEADTARRRL